MTRRALSSALACAAAAIPAPAQAAWHVDPSLGEVTVARVQPLAAVPSPAGGTVVVAGSATEVAVVRVAGATATVQRTPLPAAAADALSVPYPTAAAVLGDGSLLLAGYGGLVKLSPDRTLDPAFGTGGVVRFARPATLPPALAVLGDGRIAVAHIDVPQGPGPNAELQVLTPDGRPDASFGAGGTVRYAVRDDAGLGLDLVAAVPGGLLVHDHDLRRFRLDGTPDPGFGRHGVVGVEERDPGLATALPSGEALVVNQDATDVILRRVTAGGVVTRTRLGGVDPFRTDRVSGLQLADRGRRLLVAHLTGTVRSYRLDGRPDRRFGVDGALSLQPFPLGFAPRVTPLALPDGSFLALGRWSSGLHLARVTPGPLRRGDDRAAPRLAAGHQACRWSRRAWIGYRLDEPATTRVRYRRLGARAPRSLLLQAAGRGEHRVYLTTADGRPLPRGRYAIAIDATDAAGNRAPPEHRVVRLATRLGCAAPTTTAAAPRPLDPSPGRRSRGSADGPR